MASAASRGCGPIAAGMPGFRIPAFSKAIAPSVSPRKCWWSSETGAITVAAGRSITLVASKRPPSPTSIKAASAGTRENARNAAAVVISKKVIGKPRLTDSHSVRSAASAGSSINLPARRMRS
jgi:hypothetical protein